MATLYAISCTGNKHKQHAHHSLWSRITCCHISPRNPLRLWYSSITEGLTASKYSTFWSLCDSAGIYLFRFSGVRTGSNRSTKTSSPPNLGLDLWSSPPWPVNLWPNFSQVCMGSGLDLSSGLDSGSTKGECKSDHKTLTEEVEVKHAWSLNADSFNPFCLVRWYVQS